MGGGGLAGGGGFGGGGLETGLGGVGRFSLATTLSYLGGAKGVKEVLDAWWPALYFPGRTTLTEGIVV